MFMLPGTGGGVVQGKEFTPKSGGVQINLDVGVDYDAILAQIEPAGGQILMPKTDMGAWFLSLFPGIRRQPDRVGLSGRKNEITRSLVGHDKFADAVSWLRFLVRQKDQNDGSH